MPYIFCFSPALLLIDTSAVEVIRISITALIGIFGVAAGLEGYFMKEMNVFVRILSFAGGLMLIMPSIQTDIMGILAVAVVVAFQIFASKRNNIKEA